jgi:uncharacterized protein (TIGR03083 family)
VQDNAAHIVGTERMLRGDPLPEAQAADTSHVRNDLGATNEAWVEHYRRIGAETIRTDLARVGSERLNAIRAMSDDEFEAPSWTPAGRDTLGRFLQIRVFDSWFHLFDMREALALEQSFDGAAYSIALMEASNGLGYVVGKRAHAPEGSSVVFAVGREPDWIQVAVENGRANVVQTGAEPDAVIRATPRGFFLAIGGRQAPGLLVDSGDITLEGDTELGAAVTTNLAYMV